MHNFEWNLPTNIIYGPGEFSHIGKITKTHGKKVFLVTYQPQPALNWMVEKAVSLLEQEGLEVTVYNQVEPNP
ncbi:MAG: iron-containing alcohol dehydrogenase, partial [bacterium]|nr:iron-containing alcohol dehydrogenase [bacterium]